MPTRHRQSLRSPRRSMFALPLALLPACCSTPPPPKPAEPAPASQSTPPAHIARAILRAAWSFQAEPDACIALAKAGAASLRIAVPREGLIRLTMAVPGDAPARPVVHFNGPAGRWLIPGTPAGRRLNQFALARDEASVSRVLMLLSGGTLNLGPPAQNLPILALPESGAEGQQWFACVRQIVNLA